jgi:cysteine desulfurase / selenocysteine lyase
MPFTPPTADFPLLSRRLGGQRLVYLDNAATTQKPQAVLDAMMTFYTRHNANVHRGVHTLAEEATEAYEGARKTLAGFIGAPSPSSIVFASGTTAAINLVAQAWARPRLKVGDEVLITEMEHHSNLVPWQMVARQTGATLRYLRLDGQGRLNLERLDEQLNERTRLLAVAHTSNVLGTVNPLPELIAGAHRVGALVLVDAAQAMAHVPLDVAALDCDFLAFSGHKMLGPTGIGVLYGKRALLEAMEPVVGGGGMIRTVHETHAEWADPPWRFEAGTPPIAEAVSLAAAAEYLLGAGLGRVAEHEAVLIQAALEQLSAEPGVTLYGPTGGTDRAPVVSFNMGNHHPHDVAQVLDDAGVAVRGGHHCCQVLMQQLGIPATVRASFALYNEADDVGRLIGGLQRVRKVLGHG